MRQPWFQSRSGRSHWAGIAFLFTFVLLIIAICYYFLFPALEASKHASPPDRAKLRAYSALVQAVLLFILVAGIFMTVRIGRFFFPRADVPRQHTKYVDAWEEAGKRMETPPEDNDANQDITEE